VNLRVWIALAIGSALATGAAFAAQPAAVPAKPPAAAPTAPAAARPAAPAAAEAPKTDEILLTTPPDAGNIASGKITFAPAAFPIVADAKEPDIQRLLGQVRPIPCRTCRGTGKVTKKTTLGQRVDGKVLRPITNTFEEACPDCRCEALKCPSTCPILAKGGHLSCESCSDRALTCPALQFLAHCCGPCCLQRQYYYAYTRCPGDCCGRYTHEPTCMTCQFCTTLRNLRAAHARSKACDACRSGLSCSKLRPGHGVVVKPEQMPTLLELVKDLGRFKHGGDRWPQLRQAIAARLSAILAAHADRLLDATWLQTRVQAPSGQPALFIGQAQALPGAQGVLQYAKIANDQGVLQAILVSADPSEPLPSGRVLVGGLIIGRWHADPAASAGGVQEVPVVLVSTTVAAPATP